MAQPGQCSELAWVSKFVQDDPQGFSVDCIERLGQVNEYTIDVHLLCDALLLYLSYSNYHACGVAARSESTLCFS